MRFFDTAVRLFLIAVVLTIVPVCAMFCACREASPPLQWPHPPAVSACELPPTPVLPAVSRTEDNCPDNLVCFDLENAAKIAVREQRMKDWIREVKARCGPRDAGVTDAPPARF